MATVRQNEKEKEAPMLAMLRSDWLYSMLAGFAIGTLIVVLGAPAVPPLP